MRRDAVADRLVVAGGLDLDGRLAFLDSASQLIAHATTPIILDCSTVELIDAPTIGMLVAVLRTANRRGLDVVLDDPTAMLIRGLDAAGVRDRFSLRP